MTHAFTHMLISDTFPILLTHFFLWPQILFPLWLLPRREIPPQKSSDIFFFVLEEFWHFIYFSCPCCVMIWCRTCRGKLSQCCYWLCFLFDLTWQFCCFRIRISFIDQLCHTYKELGCSYFFAFNVLMQQNNNNTQYWQQQHVAQLLHSSITIYACNIFMVQRYWNTWKTNEGCLTTYYICNMSITEWP